MYIRARHPHAKSTVKQLILRIYDMSVDTVVIGLLLVMLVTLGFAFFGVVMDLVQLLPTLKASQLNQPEFRDLVSAVLNVFVIIELFSTFVYYVRKRRIRLSMLIDVTAVFILRDLLVTLYGKTFETSQLLVLAALLIVMVIARILTNYFSGNSNGRS